MSHFCCSITPQPTGLAQNARVRSAAKLCGIYSDTCTRTQRHFSAVSTWNYTLALVLTMLYCTSLLGIFRSSEVSSSEASHVHNGRLPFWRVFEELKSPFAYQLKVLQGHKFAWGRSLIKGEDMLFVADADYARNLLRNEDELGITTDFPEAVRK